MARALTPLHEGYHRVSTPERPCGPLSCAGLLTRFLNGQLEAPEALTTAHKYNQISIFLIKGPQNGKFSKRLTFQ